MSSNDENTTTQLKPRYQLRSNTQSFELISLNLQSSQWYHPVQLLLEIQVQVTLYQLYIRVHLKGLISGVRMLSH